MIISILCTPFFLLITTIIGLLPNSAFENHSITGFVGMFSTAFQFFPVDVWYMTLSSIVFWLTVHTIFGLVRFVLSLIPFINIG